MDGAAAAAASQALELRGLTDKGARARKKAALTALLQVPQCPKPSVQLLPAGVLMQKKFQL